MSRVQVKPSTIHVQRSFEQRLSALERIVNTSSLRDINTTGLTSAQIDAKAFSGQPYDGAQIGDSVNHLLLVRQAGHWASTTLTVIP